MPARRAARRALAFLVGCVVVALVVLAWRKWGDRGLARIVDVRRAGVARLAARDARTAPELASSQFASKAGRYALSEESVKSFAPLADSTYVYDPTSWFRRRSSMDMEVGFDDYPNGLVPLRTNSLGLREDREISRDKTGLRILVSGDSHTDGSLENSLSFAHVLERRERERGRDVEVVNAGCGGYSFHQYRLTLDRLADLHPDVFVVVVYGGNDFSEVLAPWHLFAGEPHPPGIGSIWKQVEPVVKRYPAAVAQGLSCAKYFDMQPDEIATGLRAANALSVEIAAVARERGIEPLFVYLPPIFQSKPSLLDRFDPALAGLGISRESLLVFDVLAEGWLQGMRALEIPVLDLRQRFANDPRNLYWSDLHIDIDGHALVAEALDGVLAPFVDARGQ